MEKNKNHSTRGSSLALNLFAIAFALMPLFTMSIWTYQQFFSDHRKTVELAHIAPAEAPKLFDEPIISVTFDDGWESIYSEAAPVMSEIGIPSTQYILPSQFNAPNYMSANQALSMQSAGHEIASHTYSHATLTEIEEKEVIDELDRSIQVLEKLNLINESHRTFAAPNGELDDASRKHVKDRFVLARNVQGNLSDGVSEHDINLPKNFNRYDTIGYTVGQYTTLDELRMAILYTKKHNAWFIPVYHQIDDSGERYSVTPQDFKIHMQLFRDSGIKTTTVRQVVTANQEYMR